MPLAGDHVKFTLPMASATTQLLWGAITWKQAYVDAGQLDWMVDCVRWATDYFVDSWDNDNQELLVQIGDGVADHDYWGRAEQMTMYRPAFKVTPSNPGSDVAGEVAAALAAAYIFYKDIPGQEAKAAEALINARQIFDFAFFNRGKYTDNGIPASPFYM